MLCLCRSSILLLIFCLLDLSYTENGTLKFPIISVFLVRLLCISCILCFIKLVAVLFDSFWITDFSLKIALLCHIQCFWLDCTLSDIKITTSDFLLFPFAWYIFIPSLIFSFLNLFVFHGVLHEAYDFVLFCESNWKSSFNRQIEPIYLYWFNWSVGLNLVIL